MHFYSKKGLFSPFLQTSKINTYYEKKRTTSLKPLVVFYWRVYSPIGGNWSVDYSFTKLLGIVSL